MSAVDDEELAASIRSAVDYFHAEKTARPAAVIPTQPRLETGCWAKFKACWLFWFGLENSIKDYNRGARFSHRKREPLLPR